MLRSIYKQLWNRRKSNSWMLLELLLVFCLTWYITDYLFVMGHNLSIPSHRDLTHTWRVNIQQFPSNHPNFQPAENEPEVLEANYARILNTIRTYPGVETVSVCPDNATPAGGSYNGDSFRSLSDTTRQVGGQIIRLDPAEDFFKTFAYTSGGKPVSVADFDWGDPKAIVINRKAEELLFPGGSAVGQDVEATWSKELYHIIGVVDDVKRFSIDRPQHCFYRPMRSTYETIGEMVVSIRSSASLSDKAFRQAFRKEMEGALRVGNFYLTTVDAYPDIEQQMFVVFGHANELRSRLYMMIFFLVNILLCVMGTFWYRVNQRREEMGVRLALGSPRAGIVRLLTGEGLCLLALVVLPAMLIECQFVQAGLIETVGQNDSNQFGYLADQTMLRFLITNFLTWLILSVVVLSAVWVPARNASRVLPADALHYE